MCNDDSCSILPFFVFTNDVFSTISKSARGGRTSSFCRFRVLRPRVKFLVDFLPRDLLPVHHVRILSAKRHQRFPIQIQKSFVLRSVLNSVQVRRFGKLVGSNPHCARFLKRLTREIQLLAGSIFCGRACLKNYFVEPKFSREGLPWGWHVTDDHLLGLEMP